jgi:drug/metabolite transporter (DMT)-like permease
MNIIMNITPFLTALLSWIILGETLIGTQFLGMIVIVGGVVIVQLGGSKPAVDVGTDGE